MSISNILQMFKQGSQPSDIMNQTIVLPNGAKYCGTLKNGKPDGRGTLTYNNNQRYKGEFFNGLKHGKGQYYYLKGQLYIGDWHQNKKHGKGQYFYQNGNRYTGQFINNVKHGWGRIDEDNGSYYEGYFFENNKDRTGEYFNALTGNKYMQTYDKGKILSQSKIIEGVQINQQQQNAPQQLIKKISRKTLPPNQQQAKQQREFASLIPAVIQGTQSSELNQCITEYEPATCKFNSKMKSGEQQQSQTIIPQNYFSETLLGKKISLWNKEEVGVWLNQIGFGDCIEEFRTNNIEGDSLLQLENQDLKELGIGALGDRRILLRQIQFLKLVMKSQCLGDSISKFYEQDVTLDLVRELQDKKDKRQDLKKAVIKAVQHYSSSSTSSSGQQNEPNNNNPKKASNNNGNSKFKAGNSKKSSKQISIQNKVQNYLQKKGIKLTFLIPKDQIQIIRPIGKGGYGQVLQGRWLGQTVAVKKYLKKQGFRNRHVGHFIQQVQVINKLLHPCIVLYMGMCIYDNQYGMITEFMKGGSLFDYLHKSRKCLNQEHIFYILKDVALGMSYLHGKNVLHCDLKSSNVLIDQSWNVKLCDFGLSRVHTTKKSKKKGLRVGTPHWMAPEILKGEKYEYESDVYSYGVLLWEILTGEIPYKNLSTAQIIGLVGNDEKHHIQMPKSNNKLFLDIFLLCTDRDPKKRPTFKFIVDALEKEEYKYQTDSNKIIKNEPKKEIAKF